MANEPGKDREGIRAEGAAERRRTALAVADKAGLLGRHDRTIGGRVPARLLERAMERAGVTSHSELITYALTKVAIEDDFGRRLLARKGRVPRGTLAG